MTAIYILSNGPGSGGPHKLGIHSGSMGKLRSRYITPLPLLVIHHFIEMANAAAVETEVKKHFDGRRVPNNEGKPSEWYDVTVDELAAFVRARMVEVERLVKPALLAEQSEPAGEPGAAESKESAVPPRIAWMSIAEIQQLHYESSLQYPKFQRVVDDERAAEIRAYILGNHDKGTFVFGGVIVNMAGGKYRVLDGQHRLHAIFKIGPADMRARPGLEGMRIMFDIRSGLSYEDERMMFKAINSSLPCPRMLLGDEEKATMYREIEQWLRDTYGDYMSPSKGCQLPSFNLSTVMAAFSSTDILHDLNAGEQMIVNTQNFVAGIEAVNAALGARFGAADAAGARDVFVRYQAGARRKTALDRFVTIVGKVRAKARGGKPECWLGMMPVDRWMPFICNLAIFH
jgi:hypothetical protein